MSPRYGGTWWAVENTFDWGIALLWEPPVPRLFHTRRECRAFIEEKYGYIRTREDLRRPPFNWRMPRAVKVTVEKA